MQREILEAHKQNFSAAARPEPGDTSQLRLGGQQHSEMKSVPGITDRSLSYQLT